MSALSRRSFLGLTSGLAATGLLNSLSLPQALALAGQSGAQNVGQRTLVVVDLQGGNDALNTLVPATGRYYDLRPGLGIDDNSLLTFDGLELGVHPSLARLKSFWDSGQLAALYGTGLQGQGRSHFVAQDAWRSAQPGVPVSSGWLGRWLEVSPSLNESPLRAIALGQSALAAQGEQGRPVAVQSVSGFRLAPPRGSTAVTDAVVAMGSAPDDGLFALAQAALPAAASAAGELQDLVSSAEVNVGDDDIIDDDDASLFSAATAIIQGNVGTEVMYLTIDGWDTHALQAPKQSVLLELVARAVSDMFAALEASGHAAQTTVMIVSEFGRRVGENGSQGTDHGKGGLSLLLGPSLAQGQVIGEPDLGDLDDGDLRITIDARNMYDQALRWLGASSDQVVAVLGDEWDRFRLLVP